MRSRLTKLKAVHKSYVDPDVDMCDQTGSRDKVTPEH